MVGFTISARSRKKNKWISIGLEVQHNLRVYNWYSHKLIPLDYSFSTLLVHTPQHVICSVCLPSLNYICSLFLKVGGFPQESAVKAPPPTLYILLTFDPSVWSLVADPLPLSYFPLDQCLHSCPPFPTSYPPEALAKPFQCLSSLELRSEGCSNVWTHKDTNSHPHTSTHYTHGKVLESLRTAGMDVQHFNCSIYIFVCSGKCIQASAD